MNKFIYLVIFSFFSTGIYAQMKDLVQYVNTLQGTDSHFGLSYGNTYPTTGMPYAMIISGDSVNLINAARG